MYSFRRSAIVEDQRIHGMETAKKVAKHSSCSLRSPTTAYDDRELGDLDSARTKWNKITVLTSYLSELFSQTELQETSSARPNYQSRAGTGYIRPRNVVSCLEKQLLSFAKCVCDDGF